MTNRKTTAGGVAMILMGVGGFILTLLGEGDTPYEVSIGLITGGAALVAARDAK